jgi:ADP-ribose pyrophosphatase YjhB (NUDIX family)
MSRKDNGGFVNFLGRNNVLVNADEGAYEAYIRSRKEKLNAKDKNEQINTINQDVTELKQEFSEIKALLVQLLDKK